jgi:UDP-GlcNAc:undecaprenyl-phosphate GlcNAc-1-phosphate transferase
VADVFDFIKPTLFSLIRYLIILIISYFLTAGTFSYLERLISEAGIKKLNYRGEKIPSSMGLIFVLLLPFITTFGMILSVKSFAMINSLLFLFITIAMGMMGFLDDQLGNNVKGFRGHLRAFFMEKKLTSGGLKLVFGAIIALTFTVGNALWLNAGKFSWIIFVNFFLICLAANTVNLFDLRPGRAGKVFLGAFILILLFSKYLESYISLFIPILAILLYYLPFDLHGQVMMGDVGSNLLGSSLGVMMVWMLSDLGKVIALIILISLQILAEKFSFSEIIEKYRLLRQLDEWGRGKK